ncbi:unnamed protein product [Calypogeia fissa]
MWYKRLADYSSLRVFGCEAFAQVPNEKRTELDAKVTKCVFLGYQKGVKGYRLWDPVTQKLVVSRDVSFNELPLLKEGEISMTDHSQTQNENEREIAAITWVEGEFEHEYAHESGEIEHEDAPELTIILEVAYPPIVNLEPVPAREPVDVPKSSRMSSSRTRQALKRYDTWFNSENLDEHETNDDSGQALSVKDGDPSTYVEAMVSSEKTKWTQAMHKEMRSLHDNKTWELAELPKDKQVVESKWVYKKKDGATEQEEKIFKARLVVKGFTQRKGIDYFDVFSSMVMLSTIRLLMALVVLFDLEMDQMDVVTTFLYGLLDELIFMRQPLDFVKKGKEHLVCKLLRSLYGLRQSPRQWNKRFDIFTKSLGFI